MPSNGNRVMMMIDDDDYYRGMGPWIQNDGRNKRKEGPLLSDIKEEGGIIFRLLNQTRHVGHGS